MKRRNLFWLTISLGILILIPLIVYSGTISLPKTGQTTSYATGDDGDLEKGVAWPSPRFTCDANTCTDNLTGLMWQRDAGASGAKSWGGALNYCESLSLGVYTDWHLPNIVELESLINSGQANPATWLGSQGFTNVQQANYWVSTSYPLALQAVVEDAWAIKMSDGQYYSYASGGGNPGDKNTVVPYAWCVRGDALTNDPDNNRIALPQTGDNTCYDDALYAGGTWACQLDGSGFCASGGSGDYTTIRANCPISTTDPYRPEGQDFDLQRGVAWHINFGANLGGNTPSMRFATSTNVAIDLLTGLMWFRNTSIPTIESCTGGTKTWQQALDYVACLNSISAYGYNDWRLPNRKEVLSLFKWNGAPSYDTLVNWFTSEGFTIGAQITTATSYMGDPTNRAFYIMAQVGPVRWGDGVTPPYDLLNTATKSTALNNVWPVRDAGVDLTVDVGSHSETRTKNPPYTSGDVIDITPVASNGYAFSSWSDCDSIVSGYKCRVTMGTSGRSVTATFIPAVYDYTALAFGSVNAGFNATRTITVTNNSTVSAPGGNMTFGTTTAPSTPFSIQTDNCASSTLAPNGGNCTIIVKFSPTSAGTFNSTFSISGAKTIALTGTGVAAATGTVADISVSTTIMNDLYSATTTTGFLGTPQTTLATSTLTVYNNGNATLNIGPITRIGTDADKFTLQTDNCSNQGVAISGNCTVIVRYTPGAGNKGPHRAWLSIPSDDPDENPVIVGMSGSGLQAGNTSVPTKPQPTSPANGATGVSRVSFTWTNATDTQTAVTHRLYYGTDPSFRTNTTILASVDLNNINDILNNRSEVRYAGVFGNTISIIALFGVTAIGWFFFQRFAGAKRKKKSGILIVLLIVVIIFTGGLLLNSCGGGGGGGAGGIQAGGTYYWYVEGDDGGGGVNQSEGQSFEAGS